MAIAASTAFRLLRPLLAWQRHAAERRYLAGLGDRDLKDLGLARHDVASDSALRFWLR